MNIFSQNTSNQEQPIRSFWRDYSNKSNNGQTIQGILSDICMLKNQLIVGFIGFTDAHSDNRFGGNKDHFTMNILHLTSSNPDLLNRDLKLNENNKLE